MELHSAIGILKSPVFIQYDGNSCLSSYQRCMILDRHKLVADVFKDEIFYELYDIHSDPQETVNLFYKNYDRNYAQHLYELLWKHLINTGDALRLPETLMM